MFLFIGCNITKLTGLPCHSHPKSLVEELNKKVEEFNKKVIYMVIRSSHTTSWLTLGWGDYQFSHDSQSIHYRSIGNHRISYSWLEWTSAPPYVNQYTNMSVIYKLGQLVSWEFTNGTMEPRALWGSKDLHVHRFESWSVRGEIGHPL